MGRFGGRGGRGGGRGGGGGRGVPFKPGPKLGRAVEDELAARDEDDDADDRRSGWDEMGGAPRRKKSVLDRKTMRKRAKEDKAAQRRAWATRHQKKEPGDGSGGGGGGEASGKRGGSKKRRGGAADEEGDDPRYVRDDRERGGGGAKRRRRDDGDDDDDDEDDDARKGRREKKDPNKPVTLTAEQRMGRSAYEAYKRDEAEQRRLMKKLKGRKGQQDDGMGFFFDSLPGVEILEAGDEDRRKESLSAETKKAAASFGDKLAKLRRRDAMESDDDDDDGSDDDEDDDDDLDDSDDDDSDDDTAGEENAGRDGTAGDGGVVNFDELDDALEAAFADDSEDDDDEEEDDDDAYDDDAYGDDDEGEEDEGEEDDEPKAAPPSSTAPSGKYVPPAQRAAAAAAAARASGKSESEAKAAAALEDARRRVRGLMNRMGESNVANVVGEIAGIARDAPRRAVGDACTAEILKALVDGPRASEQYAAALAAFVAGVSGELGPELGARFGRETLKSLDAARAAGNARAASNLCAVFARLHTCGLYPSGVVYGLLTRLVGALDELDAALMLSLLRCAGSRLRSEDPAGMRDFVASLQTRVAELREKRKEGDEDGGGDGDDGGGRGGGLTKRARLMLDMVVDLKNNKRVVGTGAGGAGGAEGGDQWGFPAALAKWLRASHAVGDAAVALRALTHERLVDEGRWNRGQWWLPDATGTEAWFVARAAQGRSDSAARNAAASNDEGAELLAKAKGLRMNTEARRAIFCVIMGAEDFADALDRLLGLPLADKQEREIPRVLIECCLQEKAYNPYYETLATRLCERVRSHRLTLQLCVWDQIREIAPTRRNLDGFNRDAAGANDKPKVSVRRVANLARFTAGLLVSGALAPTALKVIDFGGGLDSDERARLHHRLLLQALLSAPATKRGEVHVVFQGVARGGSGRGSGEMGALRASLGQALSSGELLEGLPKGDVATPGTVKYVKKAAREALNILQGMLA